LRPSSATDFPGIFYAQNMNNHKESKNGINVASPAHWTGCFGYKTFADLAQKNGVLASPFLHRMPEPCKCHYTVQHLLLIWVVFTQAFFKFSFSFSFSGMSLVSKAKMINKKVEHIPKLIR